VSTIDALLRATEDPEPSIRAESLRALAALADAKALPALLALLVKAKTDAERAEAEKATIAVCRQMAEADRQIEPVLAALAGAGTEVRCSLLRVLGRVPCPRALAALRAALKDANAEVQDAAVRALAEWPDAEPMGDLLAIARASANPTHKVLAFRGYVRMVALPSQRPAAETLKAYGEAMAVATRAEERKLVLAALAAVSDVGALEIAQSCLADQELEVEAAMAVAQIARAIRKTHRPEATAAVEKILQVCKAPTARQVAESALFTVNAAANIALEGAASSPDPWKDDGGSTGPQAAIDGDPVSFWDEEDNKPLYRFKVTFRQPEKVSAISILGYEHHNYAPKDFEILCDERVVKTVVNAQYEDNFLAIPLGELACKTVELKITGYYGNSPAIRELGIYTPGGKLPPPPKAEPRR
jgi:hypothetical protein